MSYDSLLTSDVLRMLESTVLCWLATVSVDGSPNVSPKEAFVYDGEGKILVAHIASPVSVQNIRETGKACASFLDVFVQKGFKIDCNARIVREGDEGYSDQLGKLHDTIGHQFPIQAVIELSPIKVSEIIAPSYVLFPETKELDMIKASLTTYRVESHQSRLIDGDHNHSL